jgi:flagellar hook-basal body complex protein FliE
MIENKQSDLRNHRIYKHKTTNPSTDGTNITTTQSLSSRKKQSFNSPLPKFFNWLEKRIHSADKRAQDFILCKQPQANEQLIFILPEAFERYYCYSGVSKNQIQSELKQRLMVTFAYTIIRDDKVIEVFPCKKFF